jgi:glutamate dehydrogenase/leucine dehydrogenase
MTTTDLRELGLGTSDAFDELARNPSLALEEAAVALDLESWIVERLRHPVEESTSYLQLVRDSGDIVCVPLYQVQHSAVFGLTIGSLSLRPDLQPRTCEAIAMERTWQAALLGLPLDGASYGLVCDPDELSERELLRLLSIAAQRLRFQPGSGAIIFPGDGCRREYMAKLLAETRKSSDLLVTGKPNCLGGLNLVVFKAEGVAATASAELRRIGKQPAAAKVAIQGFGPLGQAVSERLTREGAVLVALSDNSGGLYRADGLILDDIRSRYDREPILFGYSEADHISRADLLQVKSDVLVLTSGSNEIHGNNWDTISASIVIEAHWNAVTSTAKRNLEARNVQVIPWSIATSGAMLGAYFESRERQIISRPQELFSKTHSCVEQALAKVANYSRANQASVNQAARQLTLERLAGCLRLCGTEG